MFNQITYQNKFILFVDNYSIEKHAENLIKSILLQQNNLDKTTFLKCNDMSEEFLNKDVKDIIVYPLISEILISNRPAYIFKTLNILKHNKNVKQIFVWVTKANLQENFIIPFLEYISEQIITLRNSHTLSILTRKSGGAVSNKIFTYKTTLNGFDIEPVKENKISKSFKDNANTPNLGTFKIDLEEDEMIARNALKLPYEKVKGYEGNIIYTPDEADDFDDEDPDEDLTI